MSVAESKNKVLTVTSSWFNGTHSPRKCSFICPYCESTSILLFSQSHQALNPHIYITVQPWFAL